MPDSFRVFIGGSFFLAQFRMFIFRMFIIMKCGINVSFSPIILDVNWVFYGIDKSGQKNSDCQ